MTPETKPWYLSKTVWLNLIAGVLIFVVPKDVVPYLQDPEFIAGVFTVLNLVLRLVTKGSISIT